MTGAMPASERVNRIFSACPDEEGDSAGDLGARSLEPRHGRVERLRPEGRKDWNDILTDGRAQTPS